MAALKAIEKTFNSTCPAWEKDPELNFFTLRTQENFANDTLKARGYLTLNDVYDRLGFPHTKTGFLAGWVYEEGTRVSFGIPAFDANCTEIKLTFNAEENILPKLKLEES